MLDQAFAALNVYDWGKNRPVLNPIDQAVVDTHGDDAARKKLEARLTAVLSADVTRAAKDFVCRKLRVVGTAESVPMLAALLPQKDFSHMARYALERMPAAEAAQALRDALPKLHGELKIGVIGSLGVRQDEASIPALGALVGGDDARVARSAASALGDICTPAAARALAAAKPDPMPVRAAVADASLSCAEALLADGKKGAARNIYKLLSGAEWPKQIRLAAMRGLLACAGN